ncbi:MAG: acylphosphatase [Alphaproteobacteria bacterium]|nr:acylphosphatase [Alphaproteobacteria bacterium]
MTSKPILVRISGRVQGVGYRAWTVREATTRGLQGWVRNRQDGSVEALFIGPAEVVGGMIQACHTGPRNAAVTGVRAQAVEPPIGLTGFHQRPTK